MKPSPTILRPLASLALALFGWTGLNTVAMAQLGYTINSSPPDLVATQSGSGTLNELITTPQPPMESSDWRFSRWTVNGTPALSPVGPARTQARVILSVDSTVITAVYLPSAQDIDGDTIPDWQEWRDFGTLNYNTASNNDGDEADTALERRRGWSPALVDIPLQGGISRAVSPSFRFHNVAAVYSYSIRSEPSGLMPPQMADVPPGTEVATPNPTSELQGYWFTHWTLNGTRQAGPNGASRTRLLAAITQDDTQFVAHFTHKDRDSDGDGLADWIELRSFGHLGTSANSDPDGDSLNTDVELGRGYDPGANDSQLVGGLARSASVSLNYHNPERWVYYSVRSSPIGLIDQSGLVPTNTVISTSNEDNERQGYRLAYWTVNDTPQVAANGYALTRIQVTLNVDYTKVVAHFIPKDQDGDGDSIPDWVELRHFGHLSQTTSSDPDADDFSIGDEQTRGYTLNVADQMLQGGVSRSASRKLTFLNPSLYKLFTLISEPAGFYLHSEVLEPGANVMTPNEFGPKQSYSFGYWTLNGVRQSGPTGVSRSRLQLTADEDLNVVGQFLLTSADSDADLLPDWWEAFYLGSLDRDRDSDPDGDAFSVGREYDRGLPPTVLDLAMEGGVSRTSSRTIAVHRPSILHRYVIRSEPSGLISRQEGVVASGETVSTPLLNGSSQGFSFAYWAVNGTRQAGPSGRALNRVTLSVESPAELVAHYVGDSTDNDGDGIRDAIEWLEYGTLAHEAGSDTDGDHLALSQEVARGYSASLSDLIYEGGVSRSSSKSVLMQLAAYNVYHPLSVIIDPPGGGAVSGSGRYKQGVTARLEAVVPPGVNGIFSHWSGHLSGNDNPAFVLMDEPHSVTAHFTIAAYRLKYASTPHGIVTGVLDQTVSPGTDGTMVTAIPDVGYHFVQWSDGHTANPRTDTNVNAPVDVAATFAINVYPVLFDLGSLGTRTGGGQLSQNIEHGSSAFAPEFTVAPHWRFTGWDFGFTTVTAAQIITAQFERITHAITLQVDPPQAGEAEGAGVRYEGENTIVSLQRAHSWKFLRWSENGIPVSPDISYEFPVSGPRHLVAHLEAFERSIDPTSTQRDLSAQSYTVAVTSNTTWSVTTRPSWASVSPVSGMGDGRVTVSLDANLTALPRSGFIRFNGFELPDLDHAITQLGGGIKLSHLHASHLKTAAKGKVSVTTSHYGLAWTALSNNDWLHITSGPSGSGNGDVLYAVDALTGTSPRTGTLTIGGKLFTIVQSTTTPKGELVVTLDGAGKVSGATLGATVLKYIGKSVTLTATPLTGNRFKHWTGSGFEFPPAAETRPSLTFIMGEKVQVTAHFEPDPFAAASPAGTLRGVSVSERKLDPTTNGLISLILTKSGAYTCSFKSADGSYYGRGTLTSSGSAEVWVKRSGREPVHLAVTMDAAPDTGAIVTARLASEIGPVLWIAQLDRVRVMPSRQKHPAFGAYTALLEPDPDHMDDFGIGHASIKVSATGGVLVSGSLPDGLAYTSSSAFLTNDTWPLFRAPYAKLGYLLGTVIWDGVTPAGGMTAAPVRWVKLPVSLKSKDLFYRDGFDMDLSLLSEFYTPPVKAPLLDIPMTQSNLVFSAFGAGLVANPLSRPVTLTPTNLLQTPLDIAKLKLSVKASTGVFSVSFTHDQTLKTVKGSGVFLQKSKTAAGVFRGTTGTAGSVLVEPTTSALP
jgi:hypothetical protein